MVTPAGTFIISDEYGPYIYEFNRQGHIVSPHSGSRAKFLINKPSGDVNNNGDSLELYKYPFFSGVGVERKQFRPPGESRDGRTRHYPGWTVISSASCKTR